ncbi:hypothetical protein [Curtobacterium sp. 9128]|uniref:hypothetical protein n=1 Tax=Curtobacterium sp. 9128 TaxID=1793722 RepID=UPI0011A4F4DE|nr:hypothetical protein [Curtobacterium sp. 9128]
MSPGHGTTRTGWVVVGAAAAVCAVAASSWALATPPVTHTATSPTRSDAATPAHTASGPPAVELPWYRTGPPVDGTIVPIGADTTGHVTVVRSWDRSLRVTITGFHTDLTDADIRVQLTGGDVVGSGPHTTWIPDGDPVEVGTIPHGATAAVIDVGIPQILPHEVHSLVVLDWNTTTIMGGAELLPAG